MGIRISGDSEPRAPRTLTWPLLVVGAAGLLVALWLGGREILLRWQAVREIPGQVTGYESKQSRCGGGKKRPSRPCTKYRVIIAATGADAGVPVEVHSLWSTHRTWDVGSTVDLQLQADGRAWFCTWHDFILSGIVAVLGLLFLGVGLVGSRRTTA